MEWYMKVVEIELKNWTPVDELYAASCNTHAGRHTLHAGMRCTL